jgi:AraC family transcriptional regulator of adaptative response/methylated-DNA-[protein]-cysteine methyltransferase
MARDPRFDGAFVYGVRSTRIYCRPSCPSRRPAARQVVYFERAAEAEQGGFRACLRCRPREARMRDREVEVVVRACRALETSRNGIPLTALSRGTGLTSSQLRRAFQRIVGTSPKTYVEAFRMSRMKHLLRTGETITGALYGAGYSSPSRVYGESARRMGMTPGEYRSGGAAISIRYGTAETSLGWLLVAATDRGVCAVRLGDTARTLVSDLRREFDAAEIEENASEVAEHLRALTAHIEQRRPAPDLPLDVQGTAFQARVWDVLRKIPYGETRSYTEVARAIGNPAAVRAVARACATNPVALVIPCHRVVRENGDLGGYRWGIERKAELLEREKGLK